MRLEEVEDGDGETEAEDGSIFAKIRLDVTKISEDGGLEVFEDEYEEELYIEVFVSTDEDEDSE